MGNGKGITLGWSVIFGRAWWSGGARGNLEDVVANASPSWPCKLNVFLKVHLKTRPRS